MAQGASAGQAQKSLVNGGDGEVLRLKEQVARLETIRDTVSPSVDVSVLHVSLEGADELETLGKGDVPDLSWTDEVACCIALWPYILLFVPQYRIPKQDAYGIGNKPLRVSPPRCSICP
ncbi:hypothetical protein PTI98_008763 [Pleurotus ostreatus]|nr:hypothetical protein PTI98_009416 [Pleurotus ostreatus]KAJ8693806.1 hypothetical protein PTI98_008763 [Pleurotus ostreatus]